MGANGHWLGTMTFMETTDTKKFSQNLTRWAVAGSIAYLLLLICLGWGRWPQLLAKDLNEVGDFLAGAFSPLAFLWLVVGYFQQGHELSASVTQLERQAKVFEAQRKDEAERFKAATQPKLHIDAEPVLMGDGRPGAWEIVVTNIGGAPCAHLSLASYDQRITLHPYNAAQVAPGQFLRSSIVWRDGVIPRPGPLKLVVAYVSAQAGSQAEVVEMEFYSERERLYLRKVDADQPRMKPSKDS